MNAAVAAIVLAAGASRRLGQPKQLLVYAEETLLARALRLARESGASPVLAVLGANLEMITASVAFNQVIPVVNNNWDQGISTSIHAGLNALAKAAPHAAAALILACDQPRLTANHLRTLIETLAAQAQPSIVASSYAGVIGIPAVFPRAAFPALLALRGDKGARALLMDPPCPLLALPFSGGEVDIDEPEDLDRLA
jgi:CTP:molybdopterin cytidylyltransferase MocA